MSKLQVQAQDMISAENSFTRPEVGTALTAAAGLSFLFVCMILPLVGKSGSVTVHSRANTLAFLGALLLTAVLAALASLSKLQRRRLDQSPRPYFSLILCSLSVLLLLALAGGLLRI